MIWGNKLLKDKVNKADVSNNEEKVHEGFLGGNIPITNIVEKQNSNFIINNPYNILNFCGVSQVMLDKSRTITTGKMCVYKICFRGKQYHLQQEVRTNMG